jgi:hypothetical protein
MDPQPQTLNITKNKPIKAYGINFDPRIPLLACRVLKLVLETYRRFTANANSHIKIFHQNLKLPLRRIAYICSSCIDKEVCSFPYNKALFNDSAEYDIFQLFLQWEGCDTAIINYFKNSTALVGVWVGIMFIAAASVTLYTCWEFFKAYREVFHQNLKLPLRRIAYICSSCIDKEVCSFPYNKALFNDNAEYDIFQLFLQWEGCDTAIINYFKNSTALVGVWVGIMFIAAASVILYTCWEFFKAHREITTNTVFLDKQFYAYCYSMGYLGVTVLTLFGIGVDLIVIGHTALILVLSVVNMVIWVLFLLIVLYLYLWKRKY